ncbi:hypothetical protein [Candidatus Nanohalovita haloferacivicina]|uniref:hypothetical protein n=1 Tax=Candidatus Nanohalovita haloferacivicina TaxID=2978046 RepID=UPI00325FAA99|nr:hypothetical protein HBNXNv_0346 [Candidatus Nanohalobia archaeon BNXNv]
MERQKAALIFFAAISFALLFTTGLFANAWAESTKNVENLNSTLQSKESSLQQKTSTIDKLNQTLLIKQQNISDLERTKSNLESEVDMLRDELDKAKVWTTAPEPYSTGGGEYVVPFTIYNYGKETASNVIAEVAVYESSSSTEPKEVKSVQVGNTAGNSMKEVEYNIDFDSTIDDDDVASVYVVSCGNCEILWKNIPSLSYFEDSSSEAAEAGASST